MGTKRTIVQRLKDVGLPPDQIAIVGSGIMGHLRGCNQRMGREKDMRYVKLIDEYQSVHGK